jgi:hypothetical protein
VRFKSETLIVVSVPPTDDPAVELYNSTENVPPPVVLCLAFTEIESIVIAPGVNAEEAT